MQSQAELLAAGIAVASHGERPVTGNFSSLMFMDVLLRLVVTER